MILAIVMSTSACGYYKNEAKPKVNSVTPAGTFAGSYYEKSHVTDKQGKFWIPLKPAAASIGYRMKDDTASGGYAKLGYTDVMYMLRPNSTQVFSLGEKSPCLTRQFAVMVKSISPRQLCPSCSKPRWAGTPPAVRSILLYRQTRKPLAILKRTVTPI